MATPINDQLGLLPERRIGWRTLATSYGSEILVILFLLFASLVWPTRLELRARYNITELIPRPDLQPKPLKPKEPKPVVQAKLLPPAPILTPKLLVPVEIRSLDVGMRIIKPGVREPETGTSVVFAPQML